jgi:hypothetical protein
VRSRSISGKPKATEFCSRKIILQSPSSIWAQRWGILANQPESGDMLTYLLQISRKGTTNAYILGKIKFWVAWKWLKIQSKSGSNTILPSNHSFLKVSLGRNVEI